MSKIPFADDSMSLIVDDRFFQSESNLSSLLLFNQTLQKDQSTLPKPQPNSLTQSPFFYNSASLKKEFSGTEFLFNQPPHPNHDSQELVSFQSSDQHSKQPKDFKNSNPIHKNISILEKKKWNSKIYREKKKKYITQLEQENSFYKKKCSHLEEKIFSLQRQIAQLKFDTDNQQKCGYEQQHKKDIELLKSLISNQISNHELAKIAMKMREKYGPAGRQRREILNYYMSEYINSTLADFQKYIFHSVLKKTGPFGQSKNYLDEKMQEVLSLSEEQKNFVKNNVWRQLYPVAVSFSDCCKNIYKNYVNLLDEAKKFHDTMSKGLNYIIVPQLAKLVIWFDEYKNSIEVRRLKQDWIRLFSGQFSTNPEMLPSEPSQL